MDGKTLELKSLSFLGGSPAIHAEVSEELQVVDSETGKPLNDNQEPDEKELQVIDLETGNPLDDNQQQNESLELRSLSFLDETPAIYGEVCEELEVIDLEPGKPLNDSQQPDAEGKETESCNVTGSVTRFLTSVAQCVASSAWRRPHTEDQA